MAWINQLLKKIRQHLPLASIFCGHANQQSALVLLASLPCLLIAIIVLWLNDTSGYLIAFIAIVLLLLITYAAYTGKQRADYQIQTLANLIEALIDGDYSLRGREQTNPVFQELLYLVNQLADTLQQHKMSAQQSQLLLEKIMDQMDAMVFAVDAQNKLMMINASARKLLLSDKDASQSLTLADIDLESLQHHQHSGVIELNSDNVKGEYFLFKDQFISDNQHHDLYLLTRADRLLREKERQAWQSLLRVLGHEMNNSLTPIATFSRGLLRKLQSDEAIDPKVFNEGLSIIKERAESLHSFIAGYSQLSNLPVANKQSFDWREKLTQLTALVSDCEVTNKLFDNPGLEFPLYADPQQLEQVFINLLKNAREAMLGRDEKEIELDASIEKNWLHIKIRDKGTGIANKDNLFVPFYTTKDTGSGIGLTLCRQILMNHDGLLKLQNRADAPGAEVIITLPVLQQSGQIL